MAAAHGHVNSVCLVSNNTLYAGNKAVCGMLANVCSHPVADVTEPVSLGGSAPRVQPGFLLNKTERISARALPRLTRVKYAAC